MIIYLDGRPTMMCDWCFVRGEGGDLGSAVAPRPKRWGASRDGRRHACPRHTRALRASERGQP